MKRTFNPGIIVIVFIIAGIVMTLCSSCRQNKTSRGIAEKVMLSDYPVKPVPFNRVKLTDTFWAPRLETTRTKSVPYAFRMNEETGRVDNFRKAARLMSGPQKGKRYNDSDVFKALEAAAYALTLKPDPELELEIDKLIEIIGKAQEPDGYLFTARTIDPANPAPGSGQERWSNLRVSHELYNVGHMYEAAVAHFEATGKKSLLNIALKNAELILQTFGPGRRRGFPGHQEIEIGLAKLYRLTGRKDFLELAKFFLDERGHYYQGTPYPESDPFSVYNSDEYLQNHKPVLEQDEAVGHAVRATYMYSGMADVAALGNYPEYIKAIDRLWENVVGKKMYLTGGVGSRGITEGFGEAYELPNAEAYAETCASIGNSFWNYRLFLLHSDARYVDVFERILYNGLLSGVSLNGERFFYQNPLESAGDYERSPWFEVACCPANITRFLLSLPGYMYAVSEDRLFVNLFINSEAMVRLGNREVKIIQETNYPWDGKIKLVIEPVKTCEFSLSLRIPGWARGQAVPGDLYAFADKFAGTPVVKVNGEEQPLTEQSGYVQLKRIWKKGDVVELSLPMPVRRLTAHPAVEANRNRVALQRGPIVYCVEGVDIENGRVLDLVVPDEAEFDVEFKADLLNGVPVIKGKAFRMEKDKTGRTKQVDLPLLAIPYYAWANRGKTEMAVWLARTLEAVKKPTFINRNVG